MLTVLYSPDHISLFHSLYPLIQSAHRKSLQFVMSVEAAERRKRGRTLLVTRYFKRIGSGAGAIAAIHRLRQSFDRIVLFDDSDGADSLHPDLLRHVDLYFKKALLRDRAHYCRPMYGRQLFADHYHREHGVHDAPASIRPAVEIQQDLAKLRLSWNLGVGSYPQDRARSVVGVALARAGISPTLTRPLMRRAPAFGGTSGKNPVVHARFRIPSQPTIAHQRRLMLSHIQGDALFLSGPAPRRRYLSELTTAAGVLSPFGWGEICFRDFEAIINGAVLIKPSVAHLETWPDVFVPARTYIDVSWDGTDIVSRSRAIIADDVTRREIATRAWETYVDAFRGLDARVHDFLSAVFGDSGP